MKTRQPECDKKLFILFEKRYIGSANNVRVIRVKWND